MNRPTIFLSAFLLFAIAHSMAQPSSRSKPPSPAQSKPRSQPPVTAILGAFGDEITWLLGKMNDKNEKVIQHIHFTEGTLNGRRVVVALTGIGKVNAAITTTLVLEHFHPSEVLFSGIAGGVDPALSPGDLVIGEKIAYHDYGTLTPDSMEHRPTRNPYNNEENPLYFPCNDSLVKIAEKISQQLILEKPTNREGQSTPRIISGIIVTGDVFVSSRPATQLLHRQMNAEATEMEGAAIAQTCWQQGVPFLVIRSLSDDAGSKAYQDVKKFYQVAARNSARLVMAIAGELAASAARP